MDRREWYAEKYLRSDHWHSVQKVVYARNNGRCERCGKHDIDHVHHVHYYSMWHELEDPTAVIGLCADCHAYLHGRSSYDPAAEEEPICPQDRPDCERCGLPADIEIEGKPMCRECAAEIMSPRSAPSMTTAGAWGSWTGDGDDARRDHDLPRFDDVVNRLGDPEALPDVVSKGVPPPGESSTGTYFQDMGMGTGPARKSRRGSEAGRPEKGGREFSCPPRVELERKKGTR